MDEHITVEPVTTGPEVRQLRRTRDDRVLGGVCGGLGRYFGVDPVLLRIAAVALALSGGVGLLAYVIAWILIPETAGPVDAPLRAVATPSVNVLLGVVLVGLGGLLLLRELLPRFDVSIFGPLVVVVVGLLIVVSGRRHR